jgi:multiple sugar transport system permease protein
MSSPTRAKPERAMKGLRRSRRSLWADRHLPWLLVSPAVLMVLALSIFPLAFSLWVAFVEYDFSSGAGNDHPFVGFDNFRDNLNDPVWWSSIRVTAILAVSAVAVELVLGLLLALAMLRPFRGRRILMVLFVLPMFISPVVVGGFWDLFLRRPIGPANDIVSWFVPGDVSIDFTADGIWPILSLIVVDAWQWTPFMFVILLAGLASIPAEMYEAADIDGSKPRQAFSFVTLPLLMPIILVAVAFRFIDAVKMFDIIYTLTRGGPGTDTYTTSYFLYYQGFARFHLGQGTAGSWMFMIMLSFVAFWLVRRLLKPVQA